MRGAQGDENAAFVVRWTAAVREAELSKGLAARNEAKILESFARYAADSQRTSFDFSHRQIAENAGLHRNQVSRSMPRLRQWIKQMSRDPRKRSSWKLVLPELDKIPFGDTPISSHPYAEPDHDIWHSWDNQIRYWLALSADTPIGDHAVAKQLCVNPRTALRNLQQLAKRGLACCVGERKVGRKKVREYLRIEPEDATCDKQHRYERAELHASERACWDNKEMVEDDGHWTKRPDGRSYNNCTGEIR